MRYFSRHLYLCLQSTHLSITIELNNVDSSGLVFFWACILLGLLDRGADLSPSGDRCRLSQPGWCMQAFTAYLPPPSYSGSDMSSSWISITGRGGMEGSGCMLSSPG